MEEDKIMLYMQCLNWTCGEVAFFSLLLAKDAVVRIDWGDNHCTMVRYKSNGWQRVEHLYSEKARKTEQSFVVILESEAKGQIIGFSNGSIDMQTNAIDLIECQSLEYLIAEGMKQLDLSHCPNLKELDISEWKMPEIDLTANIALERLKCNCSKITRLNLSKCINLKEIECWCCFDLKHIGICNDSRLTRIDMDKDNQIKDIEMRFIREAIERNSGEIILRD